MENHRCWRLAIFGINKNINELLYHKGTMGKKGARQIAADRGRWREKKEKIGEKMG